MGFESASGMVLNEAYANGGRLRVRWRAGRVCGEMLGGWRQLTWWVAGERMRVGGSAGWRLAAAASVGDGGAMTC